MAKNLQSLQLLRNSTILGSKAEAISTLQNVSQFAGNMDGVAVLARYSGETAADIKTVVGFFSQTDSANPTTRKVTIYDGDMEVLSAMQAEIDAIELGAGLNADGTYHQNAEGHYISAATSLSGADTVLDASLFALETAFDEASLTIAQSLNDLNSRENEISGTIVDASATTVSGDSKVVIDVTQNNAKITATAANLSGIKLDGYAKDAGSTGAIASTDTLTQALSKLENKAAAITILDKDHTIDVIGTTAGTEIAVNIEANEQVISAGTSGLVTDIKIESVTGTELTNLGGNVREAFKLTATSGAKLGEYIKIYKDSALINVQLGNTADLLSGTTAQTEESDSSTIVTASTGSEALDFVYQLENGKYKLATVDVESFLQESEFASGVTADSSTHIVHGVVDTASTKVITAYSQAGDTEADVLTVGADGFKVDNIQAAINAAVGKAQTTVNTAVTDITSSVAHLTIAETTADNGSKSYGFTTEDIASQTQMRAVMGQSGTAYTVNTADTYISAATSLSDADDKLDAAIVAEVARAKSAETAIDGAVGLSKGASDETRTWTQTTNYTGANATVKDNMQAIDTQLKAVSDNYVSGITVNGSGLTVTNNIAAVTVSGATAELSASGNNAIVVNTDANGNLTIGLATLDCGTY